MRKFKCSVCGYVYDEAAGIPDRGIAPGTRWEDFPENWTCPVCGALKVEFEEIVEERPVALSPSNDAGPVGNHESGTGEEGGMRELSAIELSVLCSELGKACEKQAKPEEADLFRKLSDYYLAKTAIPANDSGISALSRLVAADLDSGYETARSIASAAGDHGALRALAWGGKVTRMHSSLLARYEKYGEAMLENMNVYVCESCGFVYVGSEPPALCPICKVPGFKLTQVER
ncbi:MAG: rubredoxin [Victivallaceae bacterium]